MSPPNQENIILPQLDGNHSFLSDNSDVEQFHIPVHISAYRQANQGSQIGHNKQNLRTIKRNNKILEAANLPITVVLNPRSLYNKQSNFITMIEQTESDVCLISET